ncbi:unnamed protein product [Peniophora sp. CBMAI 1063]|nr:unnamed protein product [Peniophora sp. CBMAI 1063]
MATDSLVLDYYNDPPAKAGIHSAITAFFDRGGGHCDLGRYSKESLLLEETVVVKDDRGVGYLAMKKDSTTETIVSLTAVLVDASLPPYRDTKSLFQTRRGKKDIPVNRVSLAWYGHSTYEATRVGFENIRTQFSLMYDGMDKIPVAVVAGQPAITCENRIVSKVEQVPDGVQDVDIGPGQDPNGIIKTNLLSSPNYRYVEDNSITYAKITGRTETGDLTIESCLPEELKVGMIVCVQVAPCVVPTVKRGFKVILKLRNVLAVSDDVYKAYVFKARISDYNNTPKPGGGLKRSASLPQWVSNKKNPFTMADVRMRDEREEQNEGQNESGEGAAGGIVERFGRLNTRPSTGTMNGDRSEGANSSS